MAKGAVAGGSGVIGLRWTSASLHCSLLTSLHLASSVAVKAFCVPNKTATFFGATKTGEAR
jgi:hypothetical protein